MAHRHTFMVLTAIVAACLAAGACHPATRYRVLSFFFDGVPAPTAPGEKGASPGTTEAAATPDAPSGAPQPSPPPAVARLVSIHPPYRDTRCGSCHLIDSGRLIRTPREGLCQSCHTNIPGEARYVHGPVAVSDCLACHHHHASYAPSMLRTDPSSVCLRCHNRTGLLERGSHVTLDQQHCWECHNPHGGADRFFLVGSKP